MKITDFSFDMETSDPDDVFTLCWLLGNPQINLKCITVTPGTNAQIGVVRQVLERLNRKDIPIGSRKPEHNKNCVSDFHYKWLGDVKPSQADGIGADILINNIKEDTTVVCGASLGNIASFIDLGGKLDKIVVQGGFAGDSVVPEQFRLPKFSGKETCPTFNLNGDVPAALKVIATDQIKRKFFVSKNVCHGFIYDNHLHSFMKENAIMTPGIKLLVQGMEVYLKNHPNGKAFHDPLAACTAFVDDICQFSEVEVYRQKGEWGSKLKNGSNTFISINGDKDRFRQILSLKYI